MDKSTQHPKYIMLKIEQNRHIQTCVIKYLKFWELSKQFHILSTEENIVELLLQKYSTPHNTHKQNEHSPKSRGPDCGNTTSCDI